MAEIHLLKNFVTLVEYCSITGVSRPTLWRMREDGRIHTVKVGKSGKIEMIDLKKYSVPSVRPYDKSGITAARKTRKKVKA